MNLDGAKGFALTGVSDGDDAGRSVSGAGDVNGDGFDDLIIGAPDRTTSNGSFSGQSYVVFGAADGFPAKLDLSSLDGGDGFALKGASRHETSGYSVSGAGDVNGDGLDDIIIGAPHQNRNPGRSFVVFGTDDGFPAKLNLRVLDGSNGFAVNGVVAPNPSIPSILEESGTGHSVSGAGDFNGDGFDDILIGAPNRTTSNGNFSGQSYVVFGADGGFPAALELAELDGFNGFALSGVVKQGFSGGSVSAAGDVNNDGYDDIIIGDRRVETNGGKGTGQSYVVFGGPLLTPTIIGSDGDDTLIGTNCGETIKGLGGDDLIRGMGGSDTLDGNGGADSIYGGNGADLIDGGPGADLMQGGRGNDTFIVDHVDDVVVEVADKDIDTVRSFISYELPEAIRHLVLTGDDAIDGTGNARYNDITGNDAANRLKGGGNGDEIWGGGGKDHLYGGDGDDRLHGENGNDRLYGGNGHDRL